MNNKKFRLKYKYRLILNIIVLFIFLSLSLMLINKTFTQQKEESTVYKESSNLDYKVYLKENDFYDEEYLTKESNKVFIASLIKNIEINFDYNFHINNPKTIDFKYGIVAKIVISDSTGNNNFFEKEYQLLNDTVDNMVGKTDYKLNKKTYIDYEYYNGVANKFKSIYGVDTSSKLIVYLKINKEDIGDNKINFNNESMSINIPLSQKSVDIKMNYKEINDTNVITNESNISIKNTYLFVLLLVFIFLALISLIRVIILLLAIKKKKTPYDKYISKILIEYDRLIVETASFPNVDNLNIIEIDKFTELLDVRDNIKLPIMYYDIEKHHRCCFYILHNENIYLLSIVEEKLNK